MKRAVASFVRLAVAGVLMSGSAAAIGAEDPIEARAPAGAVRGGRAPMETGWSVRAGVSHSDNVTRDAFIQRSETTPEAGLTWYLDDERERFRTRIAADVIYRKYSAETAPTQFDGGATLDFTGVVIPDRFDWVLVDNYGQALVNPRVTDSPQNRQSFNFAATGPNLTFPLGGRTDLRLAGRYSVATYEETQDNNQTASGTVAIARRLSAAQVVALGGSYRRVEFDDPTVVRSYDVQDAYVEWTREGMRTSLEATAGYSTLDNGVDKSGGLLARATLSRRLSTRTTLSVTAGTEYSNSAETFRVNQIFAGGTRTTTPIGVTGDAFRSTYSYASWETEGNRVDMRIGATYRKEAHELDVTEDVVRKGGELSLGRRLSPRLRVGARALYERRTFAAGGGDGSNWQYGTDLAFTVTRTIRMELGYDRFTGEGSGLQRKFVENRVFLRAGYTSRRR